MEGYEGSQNEMNFRRNVPFGIAIRKRDLKIENNVDKILEEKKLLDLDNTLINSVNLDYIEESCKKIGNLESPSLTNTDKHALKRPANQRIDENYIIENVDSDHSQNMKPAAESAKRTKNFKFKHKKTPIDVINQNGFKRTKTYYNPATNTSGVQLLMDTTETPTIQKIKTNLYRNTKTNVAKNLDAELTMDCTKTSVTERVESSVCRSVGKITSNKSGSDAHSTINRSKRIEKDDLFSTSIQPYVNADKDMEVTRNVKKAKPSASSSQTNTKSANSHNKNDVLGSMEEHSMNPKLSPNVSDQSWSTRNKCATDTSNTRATHKEKMVSQHISVDNAEITELQKKIDFVTKQARIAGAKNAGVNENDLLDVDLSQFANASQVLHDLNILVDYGEDHYLEELAKREMLNYKLIIDSTVVNTEVDKSFVEPAAGCDTDAHREQNNLNSSHFTISSQYQKEVDELFNNVESSIYHLGTNSGTENDINSNTPVVPSDKSISDIFWSNETFSADIMSKLDKLDSESNQTVAFDVQKMIMNNARKPVTPARMINSTFMEKKTEFVSMGPFYDLPIKVKELIKQFKGVDKLYDWQNECLKLNAIEKRKNLIYALPTSGGKTLVAEILMLREVMCRKRNAIFILPYVAIVQEKVWELSPFAVSLDILVEEYAAGKGTYPPRKRRHKNSIYIATIEKALGVINSLIEIDRLNEIGLIVVDELHLLGEGDRGSTLEALLTKLMFLKGDTQIIGMSATIGNLKEISTFLNAEVYTKNFRPVELTEYVKCENQIAKVDWKTKVKEEALVFMRNADFGYSDIMAKLDPDRLGGLVMEIVPKGSCLVFCASKKNCENVAQLICKVMLKEVLNHKTREKGDLKDAMTSETSTICPILKAVIPFGVAYHHSGLTSDERRLIEDGFRNGILCVICCTSTLAAGVNLPARRVIIRSPYVGREFLNLSRYKQMVGRAGRAGLGEIGDSILICTPQDMSKVRDLLFSPMDEALSHLHVNNNASLTSLLLSSISLGTATTRFELRNVSGCTLLAVQQKRLQVNVEKLTDQVIKDLFIKGALRAFGDANETCINVSVTLQSSAISALTTNQQVSSPDLLSESKNNNNSPKRKLSILNDTKLVISKLGKAAIKGGLTLRKAEILYDDLLKAQSSLVLLDCLHLLFLITPYDLAEIIRPDNTNYYYLLSELGWKEAQTAKILGISESCTRKLLLGQTIKNVSKRVLDRFYLTLTLHELWNGASVYSVAEKYKINRGIVQQLMTSAATFSMNVVYFCEELEEFWMFAHLIRGMSQRLQHCCTKELVPLMELPSVKQGRAKQLYKAGYQTLQSIARANPVDLVSSIEYMSSKVANELIAASKMLLLAKVETLREEAEDVLQGIDMDTGSK